MGDFFLPAAAKARLTVNIWQSSPTKTSLIQGNGYAPQLGTQTSTCKLANTAAATTGLLRNGGQDLIQIWLHHRTIKKWIQIGNDTSHNANTHNPKQQSFNLEMWKDAISYASDIL